MAALTLTVAEARDRILTRLGTKDATKYQAQVLDFLNRGLVVISAAHDWEFLRKKTTITFSDATGIVEMPADLDRVLSIHPPGEDIFPVKVPPLEFEQLKEGESFTDTRIYCITGYAQDTTNENPKFSVQFHAAPAAASTMTCWYIKQIDELSNVNHVPNLPPHIWDLVIRYAGLEAMKLAEAPQGTIRIEERHLGEHIKLYQERERLGSTQYGSIRQRSDVTSHFLTRYGTR